MWISIIDANFDLIPSNSKIVQTGEEIWWHSKYAFIKLHSVQFHIKYQIIIKKDTCMVKKLKPDNMRRLDQLINYAWGTLMLMHETDCPCVRQKIVLQYIFKSMF